MSKVSKLSTSTANRYLEFNLGHERFAVSLLSVKEVIALPETTDVPFTPDYYSGIMNLRGTVISVIDLRKRMQIKPQDNSQETAVVIMSLENSLIGVIVDSINRVLAVEPADVSLPPEVESSRKMDFILGCYNKEKDLVLFIDLSKFMEKKDLEAVAKGEAFSLVG